MTCERRNKEVVLFVDNIQLEYASNNNCSFLLQIQSGEEPAYQGLYLSVPETLKTSYTVGQLSLAPANSSRFQIDGYGYLRQPLKKHVPAFAFISVALPAFVEFEYPTFTGGPVYPPLITCAVGGSGTLNCTDPSGEVVAFRYCNVCQTYAATGPFIYSGLNAVAINDTSLTFCPMVTLKAIHV